MEFASIGSGSEGNGTLIRRQGGASLLVDCGFSAKEAIARMNNQGVVAEDLAGILVTHEHTDHIKGVARLANKARVPVFTTWGTWIDKLAGVLDESLFKMITPHEAFAIEEIEIQPIPVPHDANEPCQFTFSWAGKKLGVVTDTGCVTPHMLAMYQGCDSLMLECNHDLQMLANGPYPASLKRRVAGNLGHLNNQQAADMLAQVQAGALQHLVITHISQKNNHPDLAMESLLQVENCCESIIRVAKQDSGFEWLTV
ncbi:MAG: MBL fold metallo-hydrolase [Pseudomonadales bacterium]|nr:MBL fold metallo-hydrolase [Pseudomonadales bacterium]